MPLVLKTAPTGEPLTLAEAKAHLNVESGDDDTYINTLITVARERFETDTGRAFYRRTYYLDLDEFPNGDSIPLQMPPLLSVTSVKHYATGGATSTVSAAVYGTDTSREPGRVVLNDSYSWPSDTIRSWNGVRVEYVAGYGTASQAATEIPKAAKQAMLLLVGDMYQDRETAIVGTIRTKIDAYDRLVWKYKVVSFP